LQKKGTHDGGLVLEKGVGSMAWKRRGMQGRWLKGERLAKSGEFREFRRRRRKTNKRERRKVEPCRGKRKDRV